MAFKGVGSLDPHGGPVLRRATLANSVTFTEDDIVSINATGFAAIADLPGTLLAGAVKAIQTFDGVGVETTGVAGAATGSFAGSYLTASDNQTVAQVAALLDISKTSLYSVAPDAAIGSTTGSNLMGYHTDVIDEDNTDENDAKLATAQLAIWGVDPATAANQIVNIYESKFFGV